MDVIYNDNDILSISWDWYNHSGGAHGNYGSDHHVINLKTGELVKIDDILKPESKETMGDIIAQKIFEQLRNNLGDASSLSDAGFYAENIVPTENFYLTHKGVGFYYSPYEIAPYAVGAIEVFIPFSECRELLKSNEILQI